ncbi:MAG: hypothetical protein IKP58_05440 [Victivallales bacterium]|nr:hypothetical protein [Victivallales bacterium]
MKKSDSGTKKPPSGLKETRDEPGGGNRRRLFLPVGDEYSAAAVGTEPLDPFWGFTTKSPIQYPQFHSQNAGCVRR